MKLTSEQLHFLRLYRWAREHGEFSTLWTYALGDPEESYELVMDIDHPAVHEAKAALIAETLCPDHTS